MHKRKKSDRLIRVRKIYENLASSARFTYTQRNVGETLWVDLEHCWAEAERLVDFGDAKIRKEYENQ